MGLRRLGPKRVATALRARAEQRRAGRAGRAFYGRFVGPGSLCFDVGANVGSRTRLFLELGARVVAVEPQELCLATLRERYGSDPRVEIVPAALGASPGEAEMFVASAHTVSTLSHEWVEVQGEARFHEESWSGRTVVRVRTLDSVIDEFGVPDLCKIDVEGYELEVLRGVSRPLPLTSFEFTPEFLENGVAAVDRLAELGARQFNFSTGESMQLTFPEWLDRLELVAWLRAVPRESRLFGDVYARV